jgi:hypothetical protein
MTSANAGHQYVRAWLVWLHNEAVEMAQDTGATVAASVPLAERAILAIGRQDWRAAEALVDQARSVVAGAHLVERPRRVVRFARSLHGRGRVLGGPAVRAACGGHQMPPASPTHGDAARPKRASPSADLQAVDQSGPAVLVATQG